MPEPIITTDYINEGALEKIEVPKKNTSVEHLTDSFYAHFKNWETDFTIDYKGSTKNLEQMLEQATTEAAARDDYILGHLGAREIVYEYSAIKAKIGVSQQYLTNPQQELKVEAFVAKLAQSLPRETMSDYEVVRFVNDYIVRNTVYSENAIASPHSAYAVAIEGRGVCQGYALLAYKLLQALGIENRYITGEVASGGHAWNLVKVDGAWYHLDTTWNDPVPDRGQEVSYDYFLKGDAKMREDHYWEQEGYPTASNNYGN